MAKGMSKSKFYMHLPRFDAVQDLAITAQRAQILTARAGGSIYKDVCLAEHVRLYRGGGWAGHLVLQVLCLSMQVVCNFCSPGFGLVCVAWLLLQGCISHDALLYKVVAEGVSEGKQRL